MEIVSEFFENPRKEINLGSLVGNHGHPRSKGIFPPFLLSEKASGKNWTSQGGGIEPTPELCSKTLVLAPEIPPGALFPPVFGFSFDSQKAHGQGKKGILGRKKSIAKHGSRGETLAKHGTQR